MRSDDAPPRLCERIREHAGGVPLYAIEALRALADRGALVAEERRLHVRGEVVEIEVAPTIRALVSARLDALGALERRVLLDGAVLGDRFDAASVAALADIDVRDASAPLDALVAKELLWFDTEPLSPEHGRYGFLQGAVRDIAISTLSKRERKQRHLAAVDHLAAGAADDADRSVVLAGHLLAAAEADPLADDAPAIRLRAREMVCEAAERAAALGSLSEALALFDRGADLAVDPLDRAGLLERAGAVAQRASEPAAAAARYAAARVIHEDAGRTSAARRARRARVTVAAVRARSRRTARSAAGAARRT